VIRFVNSVVGALSGVETGRSGVGSNQAVAVFQRLASLRDLVQSTGTYAEAWTMARIDSKKFRKQREQLSFLKDTFVERRSVRSATRRL
jgi:hypothetical protein